MVIESEKELAVNIDGELIRAKDVAFTLIPHGVNIILPSGLRFFELPCMPQPVNACN
jgi:diacylglycerol kinase family enzyme